VILLGILVFGYKIFPYVSFLVQVFSLQRKKVLLWIQSFFFSEKKKGC